MVNKIFSASSLLSFLCAVSLTAEDGSHHTTPIMGWSSWNTYHVNISDSLIRTQADAMVRLGLKEVGYNHINIDDGFFGWRDSTGLMHPHPERFPDGMKVVADYIHGKGLKAGIYSDAGANTCGSKYDNDENGFGAGLYGHEKQDAQLYFNEWGFDFIKIDYCGAGTWLDLDERERYTYICDAIHRSAHHPVSINICRWAFPGVWAADIATSWRISSDIRPRWESVKQIIEKNLYLSAFVSGGHFNDMDMLEIGRGLSRSEEEVHLGMWCMMSSPLLIGCDLNSIPQSSLELLKNRELISINQDGLALQAHVCTREGEGYVLAKDLETRRGNTRAVALYNPSDTTIAFRVPLAELELSGKATARDVIRHETETIRGDAIEAAVPPHGIKLMKVTAERRLEPVRYEAEWAYLPAFSDLGKRKLPVRHIEVSDAGCGVCVSNAGGSGDNTIIWPDVWSDKGGEYRITIRYRDAQRLSATLDVNGDDVGTFSTSAEKVDEKTAPFKTAEFTVKLNPGTNKVLLHSPLTLIPPIDCFTLERLR